MKQLSLFPTADSLGEAIARIRRMQPLDTQNAESIAVALILNTCQEIWPEDRLRLNEFVADFDTQYREWLHSQSGLDLLFEELDFRLECSQANYLGEFNVEQAA